MERRGSPRCKIGRDGEVTFEKELSSSYFNARNLGTKECPSKLLGGLRECPSLPLPDTAQRQGSRFRNVNKQLDWMLFIVTSVTVTTIKIWLKK